VELLQRVHPTRFRFYSAGCTTQQYHQGRIPRFARYGPLYSAASAGQAKKFRLINYCYWDPATPALDIRNIRATIQTVAYEESRNFSLEGQFLPPYDFIDLKGKHYTNANTKNKLLVLKYWFINCVPCVEEMPELNQLLKRYRGRKDLLFVSVAMDGPAELRSFLLSHQFNYAVVPGQKTWLTNIMEARSYPTHIIVDKGGKIVKVVNTAHALKAVLSKTLAQ
jgi:thiol-disulfide isomerase/thioredoxin